MKKMLTVGSIAAMLTLGLAGCSVSAEIVELEKGIDKTTSETEVNSNEDATTTEEVTGGDVSADGWTSLTFISQGLEKGDDGEYPKSPVEIEAAVTSVELVSDSEREQVLSTAPDSTRVTLEAFDLWKVFVSERYVSGEDPVHRASYTSYRGVNSDKVPLENVSVIGFDWCDSSSFKPGFIDGDINVSCVMTLVPKGGEAPAGVQFSQYGTDSEDNPVIILKQ